MGNTACQGTESLHLLCPLQAPLKASFFRLNPAAFRDVPNHTNKCLRLTCHSSHYRGVYFHGNESTVMDTYQVFVLLRVSFHECTQEVVCRKCFALVSEKIKYRLHLLK